jgi:hypothetical protein
MLNAKQMMHAMLDIVSGHRKDWVAPDPYCCVVTVQSVAPGRSVVLQVTGQSGDCWPLALAATAGSKHLVIAL